MSLTTRDRLNLDLTTLTDHMSKAQIIVQI